MLTWCMAHPWMTFFVAFTLVPNIRLMVRGYPPDGEGD